MDGREMDVWYDVQATWKLTETDILWEGLPPTVQTAFEGGEYAQWKREDIDMLEYPVQPVQYVIEVENGNEGISCSMPETVIYCRNVMRWR